MSSKMITSESISDRISQIRSLGLSIFRDGEKIRVSPSGQLSPWDLEFLRENKPAILEYLQAEESRPSPTPRGHRPHTEPAARETPQDGHDGQPASQTHQLWVIYEDRQGNTRAALKSDWDAYHQNVLAWPAWPGDTPEEVAAHSPFPVRRSGRRKLLAIPTGEVPRCWLSADPIPWET